MAYKSQLIGYKKPTDHQNLSVFQLPYENQPFRAVFFCIFIDNLFFFWYNVINISNTDV